MTDQKKIDEARKLFEEQEIAQGRSVEMTSCGEYLDGVVFFGWLNELDRIDAEYAQAQKAAEQCETMQRPKSECGCPDCGSSLIDCPETEPAPAQDEREALEAIEWLDDFVARCNGDDRGSCHSVNVIRAALTRPAQTEQQPIRLPERKRTDHLPKEYKTMTVVRAGLEAYNRALDDVAALNAAPIAQTAPQGLRIVFDGPPGPEAGRFVEVEDTEGRSVNAGEWRERADGLWELSLHAAPQPEQSGLIKALEEIAAGEKTVWRDDHFEVENDMAIDYPGIAKAALDAYRDALSAQGGGQ